MYLYFSSGVLSVSETFDLEDFLPSEEAMPKLESLGRKKIYASNCLRNPGRIQIFQAKTEYAIKKQNKTKYNI